MAITFWLQIILMRIAQIISFRVSSRKFYEVAEERMVRNIPKTPEEAIISKYLNNKTTFQNLQTPTTPTSPNNSKQQSNKVSYR